MEDATKCADSNCHKNDNDSSKTKQDGKMPGADRQSLYNKADKPIPDNSPFFVNGSNPLSSKGN